MLDTLAVHVLIGVSYIVAATYGEVCGSAIVFIDYLRLGVLDVSGSQHIALHCAGPVVAGENFGSVYSSRRNTPVSG
jgi:hypothetical protein